MEGLKFLIPLFLLCLIPLTFSETILTYNLRTEVPLETYQIVTGTYSTETTDLNENELCSFTVLDENGIAVYRASDQYPQSNGYFSSEFLVQEPDMKRGKDYNVTVRCGTATDTNTFRVDIKETLEQPLLADLSWIIDPRNVLSIIILGLVVIIVVSIVLSRLGN